MNAQLAIYGRLGADPVERQGQSGKTFTTASLAVQLGDGDDATWFSLIAFGRTGEQLARHAKGDLVSAAGRLQLNRWTGRDGEARERLQVVADSLISARTVRPGGGRKVASSAPPASSSPAPFDDPMPSDWGR